MAAVAFCPPQFVRMAWLAVQQKVPNISNADQLVSYFDQTWMNGQFNYRQWNYFDYTGPRTNNNVEGWHSRLSKVVGKAHPNVYELVDVINREEATSKLKLQQYESGAVLPARRRKVRERERRLTTLFDRFNNGELSLDDFLKAVKHQTEF